MLTVKNLTKKFKAIVAVDNLSFTVEKGEIFGLLGPNGAGKTTTLRAILNIIKPTSGIISFNDNLLSNDFFNITGYLPEERGLYKRSRVIDVILYLAQLKNMPRASAISQADVWLKKLKIENYKGKKIEELSKGNQQKVQFITSIIHSPDILVLDEPFNGFDPIAQQEVKEIILAYVSAGRFLILSTHQMETAEKLCTDILLLNKGREVYNGTLSNLKKQFGGRHIKMEYSGDISFINSKPGIKHIEYYNNYAEVELNSELKPGDFLRDIMNKVSINNFSVAEPSLNKIFLDMIKKNS